MRSQAASAAPGVDFADVNPANLTKRTFTLAQLVSTQFASVQLDLHRHGHHEAVGGVKAVKWNNIKIYMFSTLFCHLASAARSAIDLFTLRVGALAVTALRCTLTAGGVDACSREQWPHSL